PASASAPRRHRVRRDRRPGRADQSRDRRLMARSVVLVHGAWHGSWCWGRVMPLLRDAGVDTTAVDLPSRSDPLGDLHGDAAHVRSVLDASAGEVVLVGHSYGGAVITGAGTHDAVAHLVYLCAFALDKGESCMAAA